MKNSGLYIDKYFLSPTECRNLLTSIYSAKERSLLYGASVLDGNYISLHLGGIKRLLGGIQKIVDDFSPVPVALITGAKHAINVHFTPPGGEYRWHYGNNAIKAVLYLNRVEGEIDIFENYRVMLDSFPAVQRFIDRILNTRFSRWIFSKKYSVLQPQEGELVIMKSDRCLHSMRPVRGTSDRVSIIFLFDTPGKANLTDPEIDPNFSSGPGYFPKSA